MYLESIICRVSGVTFNNDDGSSRQRYISKLDTIDRLFLVPFEYEGSAAFHIVDCYDHCIGNLPKEYVNDVLEHQDQGHDIKLSIMDILGKDENGQRIPGYNLGVEIGIDFYDDQPEAPEEKSEPKQLAVESPAAPVPKAKQKTGRVMIGFGVFFALGFFVAFNPVVLVIAAVLLFFGFRRYKAFRSSKKENGESE